MNRISESLKQVPLSEVWTALGGGPLHHGRGRAFWRPSDGFSVSLNLDKGLWYDFVTGEGGDVFELIKRARGCGFRDAAEWLGDFIGISVSTKNGAAAGDTDWYADLRWARRWKIAVRILAEWALEELPPADPERAVHTQLLDRIRLGDASLVAEYRDWRSRYPRLTTALCDTGQLSDARVQRWLARWVVRHCDGAAE
ncbi:MAG TPA: hypothetical protein VKB79_09495 [Bryobacteraceae bacterium]|nr:hypothetical protein [Bryobacteraceae bacterium]